MVNLDKISVTDNEEVPELSKFTTGDIDEGTGTFDVMMRTVKLHLQQEFDKGRITGSDYATVYLGAMGNTMQQALALIISNATIKKTNAELGLLRQKTVTEIAQTKNVIPEDIGFTSGDVEGLAGQQIALYLAQTVGLSDDAIQKVLKMMLDTWSVRASISEGTASTVNGLDDESIGVVMDKALESIGITQ